MLLLVELSGENQEAALEEIEAVASTNGKSRVVSSVKKCSIVEGAVEDFSQLAFCNRISEIIGQSENLDGLSSIELPAGTFYVRKIDPDECGTTVSESEIGATLESKGRINFRNPDYILIAAHIDHWYLGIVRFVRNKKEFGARRAPMRPFFSPVSLDPKLARFMINISKTKPNDTILDPFCGTGGILIEAGILKRNVLGNDFSLQMVMGARMNLKYFGIKGEVMNLPITDLMPESKIDAIVTDLPYGRSSPLDGNRDDIYLTAMEKFSEFLPSGKRAIVMIHDPKALGSFGAFKEISIIPFRIHRSLTRHVVTLIRK